MTGERQDDPAQVHQEEEVRVGKEVVEELDPAEGVDEVLDFEDQAGEPCWSSDRRGWRRKRIDVVALSLVRGRRRADRGGGRPAVCGHCAGRHHVWTDDVAREERMEDRVVRSR